MPPAADLHEVLELSTALIREPTPNPPGEERALAEWLGVELERRGLQVQLQPVDPEPDDPDGVRTPRANVLARLPGRGGRPALILSGHLDTVPPGEGTWARDPYTPSVEGDRLYGLGASDMKGAIAAMVAAATGLAAQARAGQPLEGDLLLAFTSGEETGSRGARALALSGLLDGAAGVVIGEPTGNQVAVAEKGGTWMEVILLGSTAHGSLPELGNNAVAGLAELLFLLEQVAIGRFGETGASPAVATAARALIDALIRPAHPLLGVPTLVATQIAGGVAINVVPDRASAILDIRTLPAQSNAEVCRAVTQLAEAVATTRGLSVKIVDHGMRPALETPADHALVRACAAAVERVTGRAPAFTGLTGATDATELVPRIDLPFVICGPGQMAQAHQPNEFVSIRSLSDSVAIYAELARAILGP